MWYVKTAYGDYCDICYCFDDNEWVCYADPDNDLIPYYETQEAAQEDIDKLGEIGVFLVPVFEQEEN